MVKDYEPLLEMMRGSDGDQDIGPLKFLRERDGMGRFVQAVVDAREEGAELAIVLRLPPQLKRELEIRLNNPCLVCRTYQLEDAWVGSAYCSLGCCLDHRLDNLDYAENILQSYEKEQGVDVCRSCGNEAPLDAGAAEVRRAQPWAANHDPDRARHRCRGCAAAGHERKRRRGC